MIEKKKLKEALSQGKDCLVIGNHGWGKGALIKEVAGELGLEYVSVFPGEPNAVGRILPKGNKEVMALPMWTKEMFMNPTKMYLVHLYFFQLILPEQMNFWHELITQHTIGETELNNIIFCGEYSLYPNDKPYTKLEDVDFFDCVIKDEEDPKICWERAFRKMREEYKGKLDSIIFDKLEDVKDVNGLPYWESPYDVNEFILKKFLNKLKDLLFLRVYEDEILRAIDDSKLAEFNEDKEARQKFEDLINYMRDYLYKAANKKNTEKKTE
ncbi:MAG: hypothetical protein ACOYJG_05180 [Prevotella sp.]|jgi:hypothetical protein